MNKQIEEMAYEMTQYKGKMCERIEHNDCLLKFHTNAFVDCNFCKLAEYLIAEKSYRKQREGEWKAGKKNGQYGYYCTNCEAGFTGENAEWIAKSHDYCPKCGAKMKGGE